MIENGFDQGYIGADKTFQRFDSEAEEIEQSVNEGRIDDVRNFAFFEDSKLFESELVQKSKRNSSSTELSNCVSCTSMRKKLEKLQ